jgi:AcrR family transcriptional regulator
MPADRLPKTPPTGVPAETLPPLAARQRLLDTAYDLFSTRGIRGVGVDEVIARAGVAKATLYRHFPSKNDLVLAFLERREELWTHGFIAAEATRRGATPEAQLLAIFDVFDDWFRRRDFAEQAALRDSAAFAHSWHILMKGSIIAAAEGDLDAAKRAKAMARRLIDSHRSPEFAPPVV